MEWPAHLPLVGGGGVSFKAFVIDYSYFACRLRYGEFGN